MKRSAPVRTALTAVSGYAGIVNLLESARRADYGERLIERLAAEGKATTARDQDSVAEQKRGDQ